MPKLNIADLFCGAGGTSHGAVRSGAARLRFALNHWKRAIETHSLNFPDAIHVNSKLEESRPSDCRYKLHALFASPECTGHSNAAGGQPKNDQSRCQSNDVLPWLDYHRPEFGVFENVREIQKWGPLDKHGHPIKSKEGIHFQKWLKDIKGLGYDVEFRLLNAADYGAATSRTRLITVLRQRYGRKAARIPWPEATHDKNGSHGLPRWRGAHEIVDWNNPFPSIFTRDKPLAENTLRRIAIGLRKFCLEDDPFLVHYRNNCDAVDLLNPVPTITAGGRHMGLAMPFMAQWDQTGSNGKGVRGVDDPMYTLCTKANTGIAVPIQYQNIGLGAGRVRDVLNPVPTIVAARENHGIMMAYMVETAHGNDPGARVTADGRRALSLSEALRVITTKRSTAVVMPVFVQYYGTGHADSTLDPLATITTKTRHGAAVFRFEPDGRMPHFTDVDYAVSPEAKHPRSAMASLLSAMIDLGVADIGFRMLENPELALAQGFSPDYQFVGGKADVTKQIGNSVSPNLAEAITIALAS